MRKTDRLENTETDRKNQIKDTATERTKGQETKGEKRATPRHFPKIENERKQRKGKTRKRREMTPVPRPPNNRSAQTELPLHRPLPAPCPEHRQPEMEMTGDGCDE